MSTSVEVEVAGRWGALALYQRLNPYRSYLVQAGREHCLAERGIGAAPVHVDSSGEGGRDGSR